MFGSYPDFFTIDYSTGNLFYTAVPFNSSNATAFSGIGVVTPDGLHKKLITYYGQKPRGIVVDPEEG